MHLSADNSYGEINMTPECYILRQDTKVELGFINCKLCCIFEEKCIVNLLSFDVFITKQLILSVKKC